MSNYRLSCESSNSRHTVFTVFDRGETSVDGTPVNCGRITILTSDLVYFLQRMWRGDVFWNGKCPDTALEQQLAATPTSYAFQRQIIPGV